MTFALIYHDIADPGEEDEYGFPGAAAARYKLSPDRFEAHLDAIAEARVAIGLAQDDAQAVLTFDDGGASAMRVAEALERRGWRGHYFITTSRIGSAGFLGVEELRELAQRGHEVGSHSHSHPTYMGALSRGEIEREWCQSRDALNEILGAAPVTAAVPGGFVSRDVVEEAARAGYRLLMTSFPTARSTWHDGLRVDGRYTVWRNTSSKRAAAYARGDRVARASLWLSWQAKSAPKKLSPRMYELLRQRWARSRTRQ
jgi:peptidoglycan/xylan/chitin deacetylase (PgdA/CDA1 family)